MDWILIIGAKSDIALALAHKFADAGFNLYLACRQSAGIADIANDIKIRYKVEAVPVEFDALDYSRHNDFYNSLENKIIGIVCAVGYLGETDEAFLNFKEAEKIINTNYTGCVSIINIIAADFEKRCEGFIIGISSVAGDRGRGSNYYYGSAKAGFSVYLSGLRNRLHKSEVEVITVKPGFVRTKMTENLELPSLLTEEPEQAANDIFNAYIKKKDIIYTRWFWRYIMLIIKSIPEFIFKKLNL